MARNSRGVLAAGEGIAITMKSGIIDGRRRSPRRGWRGPSRKGRARYLIMEYFYGCYFRDHLVAAPLKRSCSRSALARMHYFRDHLVAAPLKHVSSSVNFRLTHISATTWSRPH